MMTRSIRSRWLLRLLVVAGVAALALPTLFGGLDAAAPPAQVSQVGGPGSGGGGGGGGHGGGGHTPRHGAKPDEGGAAAETAPAAAPALAPLAPSNTWVFKTSSGPSARIGVAIATDKTRQNVV